MMKRYFLLLLVLCAIGCKQSTGQTSHESHKENVLYARRAKLVHDKITVFPTGTELSIALIQKGKTEYYGVKWNNNTLEEVNNSKHLFEVGSITKVYTATILASLVTDNKIKLKEPIQKHLDLDLGIGRGITFVQLANHTSGLPWISSNLNLYEYPDNPYKTYDQNKLRNYLTEGLELKSQPGIKYEYSNFGAALLGFVMTSITGSSYEELLQEKVFKVYDMSSSTTVRGGIQARIVPGLDTEGNQIDEWDFMAMAPAMAVISSMEDLVKFANAQFNLNDAKLVLMQQPTFNANDLFKVGLGWHILKKGRRELIWHNGGTGGYSSSMALDLNTCQGVIVLSNVSTFHPKKDAIDEMCFALIETIEDNK